MISPPRVVRDTIIPSSSSSIVSEVGNNVNDNNFEEEFEDHHMEELSVKASPISDRSRLTAEDLENTLHSVLSSHLDALSSTAKDVTQQVAVLRHEHALREEEEEEEKRRRKKLRENGNPNPNNTNTTFIDTNDTSNHRNSTNKKARNGINKKTQKERMSASRNKKKKKRITKDSIPHARIQLSENIIDDVEEEDNTFYEYTEIDHEKEEERRFNRRKGWNDTVGSPRRGSMVPQEPLLFVADLNVVHTVNKKVKHKKKESFKQSRSKTNEQMTSNGLIAHVPANPAWVGAGRRTSMFGTTRTASVQQNHRGTVLTTPSSKIFNEK